MKTKYALLTGLAMMAVSAAVGQVEHDDMYFSSKDRAKLKASKQEVLVKQYKQEDLKAVSTQPINPTDSYSGRGVNPEYTNRLKTNPNSTSDSQYFVSGYQPTGVNQNIASNKCNCTNSNYLNSAGYGYPGGMYSGFGSPYSFASPYSSFYSPWGMNSGFYQPGWSSMLGYSFGGMSSGWFGGMSYGSSFGSPYGYGSSSYNGYGYNPYGYNPYGYGNNVVVINNATDYQSTVYGKRSNRSSDTNNVIVDGRPEANYTRNGRAISSGRTSSDGQSQYYDRGWKRDPEKNPSRSFWSDNNSTYNSGSGSRSGWSNASNTGGRQSSSSSWGDTHSRSSFSNSGSSFGGSSRSSSGSFGGSTGGGGGGHSRGRD